MGSKQVMMAPGLDQAEQPRSRDKAIVFKDGEIP
jgi:hypothetical protein